MRFSNRRLKPVVQTPLFTPGNFKISAFILYISQICLHNTRKFRGPGFAKHTERDLIMIRKDILKMDYDDRVI